MRKLKLSQAEVIRALIGQAVIGSEEHRFLHRLHCALLVSVGRSCYEVADWFGADPRTVERWVHAYDAQGPEGLKNHHAGGRPCRLSAEQMRQLKSELRQPPRVCGSDGSKWDGKLVARHLERRYGIRLGTRQCQRLLHQALCHVQPC